MQWKQTQVSFLTGQIILCRCCSGHPTRSDRSISSISAWYCTVCWRHIITCLTASATSISLKWGCFASLQECYRHTKSGKLLECSAWGGEPCKTPPHPSVGGAGWGSLSWGFLWPPQALPAFLPSFQAPAKPWIQHREPEEEGLLPIPSQISSHWSMEF